MRLLSAVFRKEMVTLARRKRHYFARALILGSLLTVIGVASDILISETLS